MPTAKETFTTNMNALADSINSKAGTTGTKTITQLKTAVDSIPIPSGKVNITTTSEVNVSSYATAQVSDADLVAGNIKVGVDILGVTGTYTNDATATAGKMLYGSIAYVNGSRIVGSIPTYNGAWR